MSYLEYSQIKQLHLELSNHCNAACPQCDRNVYGAGVNPRLKLASLSLEEIQLFFPQIFCAQLNKVLFSGVHGDPMVAPHATDVVEYFIQNGTLSINIQTNGSMHSNSWWTRLGILMNREKDEIVFGIDGLEDTHHLYRRNTSFHKTIENMRAFIAAGGRAVWSFLIFKHNEHQVETARQLAKEWGCEAFRVRMTSRFHAPGVRHDSPPMPVLQKSQPRPVNEQFVKEIYDLIGSKYSHDTDFSGLLKDYNYEYKIEETTLEKYRNSAITDMSPIISEFGSMENYFDKTKISCQEKTEGRIYVDSNGRVWPCCYIGGDTKSWHHRHRFRKDIEEKLLKKYGDSFNDLHLHSLSGILSHVWLKNDLEDSWSRSVDDPTNPRVKRCGRTCGEKFTPNKFDNSYLQLK